MKLIFLNVNDMRAVSLAIRPAVELNAANRKTEEVYGGENAAALHGAASVSSTRQV